MSNQITITLPDDVYQKAEHFARLANRDLASVLVDTIQVSIPPISLEATTLVPHDTGKCCIFHSSFSCDN